MSYPIERFLAARPVMILDGALATLLEQRGADLKDKLWSAKILIERPDLIERVHLDYFRAGADVAITATYQATFEGFAHHGLATPAAARLMRDAVTLALRARDEFWSGVDHPSMRPRPLVAASVGPYGAMLADGSEYRGGYAIDDRELEAFHRPRLEVLAGSGADLLAFETIPCLREALVLARLLEEFPSMSAWMSFSCRDGRRNCEGEAIGTCAAALGRYDQIGAIGINCTRPEFAASLIANLRTATDKPLVAYPNSGERYDALTKTWHGHAVHDGERALPFAELSKAWVEAGARLIGGCCRTTPEDIAELAAR